MTEVLISLAVVVGLLALGLIFGQFNERRHFADIARREQVHAAFPLTDVEVTPPGMRAAGGMLVTGGVVIASDYMKTFLSSLRMIVGGEMRAYEKMMNRARREARLRMVEQARARGATAVINVRFETSQIGATSRQTPMPISEVLCYGTAVLPGPGG